MLLVCCSFGCLGLFDWLFIPCFVSKQHTNTKQVDFTAVVCLRCVRTLLWTLTLVCVLPTCLLFVCLLVSCLFFIVSVCLFAYCVCCLFLFIPCVGEELWRYALDASCRAAGVLKPSFNTKHAMFLLSSDLTLNAFTEDQNDSGMNKSVLVILIIFGVVVCFALSYFLWGCAQKNTTVQQDGEEEDPEALSRSSSIGSESEKFIGATIQRIQNQRTTSGRFRSPSTSSTSHSSARALDYSYGEMPVN